MDFIPLITIPVIYFLTAIFIRPHTTLNICSICAAVSFTWIFLLILWVLGYEVSMLSIGILMGMSVTGLMYKTEGFYKKKDVHNFWFVRLILILGGFYFVIMLLLKQWNYLLLIAVSTLLLSGLATFLFQGTTHKDVLKEQEKLGRKSEVIKRLDNCC